MMLKWLLFGVALCVAVPVVGASAQTYGYPTYPAYQPTPTPPSWSYDPYTSGQAPCPQKRPGDTQACQDIMPPTYGQPSYWPQR